MRLRDYLSLLVILIIAILLRIHIINNININSYITQPLLFTDLLGKGVEVPWRMIFTLDLLNIFLIFFTGKKMLTINFALLAALLYAILPWIAYAQLFSSLSIFLIFFLLLFFLGILLMRDKSIGLLLIIISSFVLLYSSIFSWFILPFLSLKIYRKYKINLRNFILIVVVIIFPILILSLYNFTGLKNIFNNQISFLSDPGLKNSINAFQGESRKAGFSNLVKISENKYLYYSKYLLLKITKNIIPATYFTSQEKMFNFSFSPPIYFGFLIPLLYALYLLIKSKLFFQNWVFFSLIIPSMLSRQLVNLNLLILFVPVLIFLISYGLVMLYQKRKKTIFSFLLYLSLFLVVIQLIVTISDIRLREPLRYSLSMGKNLIQN